MRPRPMFLALLLFAQLTLALTLGMIDHPTVDLLIMPLSLLLPLLLLLRAPVGTPPLPFAVRRASFPAIALLPAFILLTAGLSFATGLVYEWMGLDIPAVTPQKNLLLALLFDALLPAIAEELFCRGALFAVLRPLGRRAAVFGSAFFFAVMHANLAQLPYAFVAGLLLALLLELTGSLLYPMLFHFANNTASLLLFFGAPPLAVFLPLGGAALLGLLFLFLYAKRHPPMLPAKDGDLKALFPEIGSLPVLSYLAVILTFMIL